MEDKFQIIRVPDDASHKQEPMGTKQKFWFRDHKLGLCLCKLARPNTGEDWAEKIAAELCHLLRLPHARYELATWRGRRSVVSPFFIPESENLFHGNEILRELIPDYPNGRTGRKQSYRVSQHTLKTVLDIMQYENINIPTDWSAPAGVATAADVFVGYLLLDAWIGNTDRHHENWALLRHYEDAVPPKATIHLAPTYDHASSLGRNETDERRKQRLTTKDAGFSVQAYVEKSISAFYNKAGDTKPLTTFDVFKQAAREHPNGARSWLGRLNEISLEDIEKLFGRIPDERISLVAAEFGQKILELNRARLLALQELLH